jgi:RNA polymerase sigma-70 factor, ECF subfamily
MRNESAVQRTDGETLMLVERCQSNQDGAYNELLSRYHRRIFNTAYRILGEEASAEDALQETLVNIFRGLHSFRGEAQVSTWISRITVNVCLGMLRKSRSRPEENLDDDKARDLPADVTAYIDPLEHTRQVELKALIEETFRRMSDKQGAVVRLHDLEGNTIQEIADIIECPVGTVKSRLFYGRQEFKDIYNALLRGRGQVTSLN